MAQFDAKRVSTLEWAGIGAGVLALLASLFPWWSASVSGLINTSVSASAWEVGIGGWLPVLMLIAAAVLVLLPHFGTQVQRLPLIWLILAGAATVIIVIRWLTMPSDSEFGVLPADAGFSAGTSFGLFIGLIAAIVSTVGAGLAFRNASAPSAAA
ncbi:hypothetical protein [Labedaea rhizosphaerae]|uniref:Uncharacterized protein n=1 Tax=Labedaea rhizosphaerae TaxID=598644 RepID=A0A4R6SEF8_LABRH|nr:hypothetical protein [Labedaea rhizosphaerae]TDP98104.1 hypothetical protein EV186_1031084 [Labedaea rhizosphaerae]